MEEGNQDDGRGRGDHVGQEKKERGKLFGLLCVHFFCGTVQTSFKVLFNSYVLFVTTLKATSLCHWQWVSAFRGNLC